MSKGEITLNKMNTSKQNQKTHHNNTPWFIAILLLCMTVLILSGVVFYVVQPHNSGTMINQIFPEAKAHEGFHIICIDENVTLKDIAEETHMSYDELYKSMNIAPGTDPNTRLCELFEDYELPKSK